MDVRDWFIIGIHAAAWIAATVFLFLHPDSTNFITWVSFSGAVSTAYHWLDVRDSKIPDARQ